MSPFYKRIYYFSSLCECTQALFTSALTTSVVITHHIDLIPIKFQKCQQQGRNSSIPSPACLPHDLFENEPIDIEIDIDID
jgi:hypothetical protein